MNTAEGQKQSVILASEALHAEQVNRATGKAEAIQPYCSRYATNTCEDS